eukprot:8605962-Heterocapsa_arctica.AAC.1
METHDTRNIHLIHLADAALLSAEVGAKYVPHKIYGVEKKKKMYYRCRDMYQYFRTSRYYH